MATVTDRMEMGLFGPNKFSKGNHKERMKAKRRYYHNVVVPFVLKYSTEPLANLSVKHPDYGMTAKEFNQKGK